MAKKKKTAKKAVKRKTTARKTAKTKRPSAAMMRKSMTGGECGSCR